MNNILIKINSSLLTLSFIEECNNLNINKTNIVDSKQLLFTYQYIKDNINLVSNFLNTIIIKNNIDKIRVNNVKLVTLALDLIKNNNIIKKMLISEDKVLDYEIFLKLLDNHTLEYLNCYDLPPYLLERLDINKNLKIDIRSEIFFVSKFMKDNKLVKYSDIYYKKDIVIAHNFDKKDIEDFKSFLNINKYLKTIHIKNYTNDLVFTIIDLFKEYNLSEKNIVFYENNNISIIVNSINYLKSIYNSFLENNKINFKVVYSREYKRKNLLKQLNFVTLKYICFVVIVCAIVFSGIDFYNNYTSEKGLNYINNEITDILDNYEYTDENNNEDDVEYIDTEENENNQNITNTTESGIISSYYTKYNQMFEELNKVNDETVGWLTVNNTKVNYPVVQHTDNSYYLKHDFNKKGNNYGWIYLDYRNNIYNMSNNTIIYGHNLKNGMMFGTLRYATNESWYKNSENQIITFNSKVKNMKWKIFSIYKVPVTNDYLYANFSDLDEFKSFVDSMKARSIYDFGVEVNKEDYILTLSTCSNTSAQRLVIHAVLMNE